MTSQVMYWECSTEASEVWLYTVQFRDVSIQSLRNATNIFVEGFDKLTNIEGLLWQAGLRQTSSKPPKK